MSVYKISAYILLRLWGIINPMPIPVLVVLLCLAAVALGGFWPKAAAGQSVSRRPVRIMLGFFVLLDAALLLALPWLGLSFGLAKMPLIEITVTRFLIFLFIELGLKVSLTRWPALVGMGGLRKGKILLLAVNVCISVAALYGMYIGPFDLKTVELSIPGQELIPGRSLRILHLSDLHVERITKREREALERWQALQPDIIMMTGDYVNIDYNENTLAMEQTRWLLSHLSAPYGVFAVTGTVGVDTPDAVKAVFEGMPITLLQDEFVPVHFPGGDLILVGVNTVDQERDQQAFRELAAQIPPSAYTLLLHHTSELIEVAAEQGVDIYLAGHTHGGQVRLPFYGPLIKTLLYKRKYDSGLYTVGGTQLYISRGLGMEGLHMPRVRFLCPPEISLIELDPQDKP